MLNKSDKADDPVNKGQSKFRHITPDGPAFDTPEGEFIVSWPEMIDAAEKRADELRKRKRESTNDGVPAETIEQNSGKPAQEPKTDAQEEDDSDEEEDGE